METSGEINNYIKPDTLSEKTTKPNALEGVKGLNKLFETNVIGKENLESIPQGKNVIIVTSHTGNWDIPLVINALNYHFTNPTVAEESTHFNPWQDPANYFGHSKADSFKVDYDSGKKTRRGEFNIDNFEPMRKSLEEGKPLFIAGHYDPAYKDAKDELPEQAGNGAAYLAQITRDAILLPVAIDVKLDKPLRDPTDALRLTALKLLKGKTNVNVIVGKPFIPEHIDSIEQLGEILKKRKNGLEITKDDLSKFSELRLKLKEQSKVIMQHLAELLPPEKRGVWGKK